MVKFSRCLEKNPENRPAMEEIIMHPFFSDLPENDYQVKINSHCTFFKMLEEKNNHLKFFLKFFS